MEHPVNSFECPSCTQRLSSDASGLVRCGECNWTGVVEFFNPARPDTSAAEPAGSDDAICLHHPSKKAVATCAATGNYICSLCSIEISGKNYSVQYIQQGGQHTFAQAFARYLPRPDAHINAHYSLLLLFPLNYFWALLGVIWIPFNYVFLAKASRMRKTVPVYGAVVGRFRLLFAMLILLAFTVVWILIYIANFTGSGGFYIRF